MRHFKQIIFRTAHLDDNIKFSHWSYWGRLESEEGGFKGDFTPPPSDRECTLHDQQFIGKLDINGKRIYDGDIVKYTWQRGKRTKGTTIAEVYWDRNMWKLSKNDTHIHDWALVRVLQMEVIGNVYETPELVPQRKYT